MVPILHTSGKLRIAFLENMVVVEDLRGEETVTWIRPHGSTRDFMVSETFDDVLTAMGHELSVKTQEQIEAKYGPDPVLEPGRF